MSSFQLFSDLNKNVSKKDLPLSKQKEIIQYFNKMQKNDIEIFLSLIRSFQIHKKNYVYLPYNIKKNQNKCTIEIPNLPSELKHILYRFIKKYKENLDN